ncbi:hypothetical protein PHYSODRAFT_313515 [Phytophthora sojae]|uniref:Jacalin-type lectin domain-containing protein n=1 Tax=Phytophthora sojae (strain P6497) TaxID=1094619 RepID=G4ZAY9_PHYSP|nr:hypothetical protein PHYSODRAFT_313515 [Phytophthora sojae]EGZ21208.1 hypothetical protein PHYSODRAFT_313515 [Phytophthora sojae]|eukprot:XP_009523925.1 hypothetical protein PHYSODRAFT_313515 [Phytophthora sojae]
MKFVSQLLVTVALAATGAAALENGLQLSEVFGGPHGNKYSDLELVSPGHRVKSITIRTSERLNGVGLDIVDPAGVPTTLYHGGRGGAPNTPNNTVSGGTRTTKIGKDTAPEGYQLGGFVGTCGTEVDSVGAIWTRIKGRGRGLG